MTLILSGTNGLSDVDGDASTPAVRARMLILGFSSLPQIRLHSQRVVQRRCGLIQVVICC
jgi:hypothetical protein